MGAQIDNAFTLILPSASLKVVPTKCSMVLQLFTRIPPVSFVSSFKELDPKRRCSQEVAGLLAAQDDFYHQ